MSTKNKIKKKTFNFNKIKQIIAIRVFYAIVMLLFWFKDRG